MQPAAALVRRPAVVVDPETTLRDSALRMDAEEVSALHELEINNEQLARDLDRAKRDRDKSDAAKTEYEQRSTQFEQSKSRISAQKARIDSLVLRAPLDGMVLRRDGFEGGSKNQIGRSCECLL